MKTLQTRIGSVSSWGGMFLVLLVCAVGYSVRGEGTVRAVGTGRTTGHIATLTVSNTGEKPMEVVVPVSYIPSTGRYQSYVVTPPIRQAVAPGTTARIPVSGYCADIHRPPVPDGAPMPGVNTWIPATAVPAAGSVKPSADGPYEPRPEPRSDTAATYPGTETPLPFIIDFDRHPEAAAPFLIAAVQATETAYDKLNGEGKITTPFSANRQRERESVVQQTIWVFAADLRGKPYTKEDFSDRLQGQLEQNTGKPLSAAPPPVQEQFQEGVDDFWDTFTLVGLEAKVLSTETVETGQTGEPETPGTTVVVAPACTPNETLEHTPKNVNVKIADSYGDDESRATIIAGIKEDITSDNSSYMTASPPATVFSLWGHDHIGGNASAYAKTVFLEANDQEWVWSTDPMSTTVSGTGTHTLAYTHTPDCAATVAGSALVWVKASSSAFDPLENSIEVFRALDKIKELSVEYSVKKLPPGVSDAIEAGVNAITDPASDTYAAAAGDVTITVGTVTKTGQAHNRVVYKRKDKEDKAIVGGGSKVLKLTASDVLPDSLTSTLSATATMEAGATGNGFAKAHLESLYGTILVGVCECDGGVIFNILTDAGLFVRSETAKQQAELALKDMQAVADAITAGIADGTQDTDGEALKERIENDLQKWAEGIDGSRFAE